MVRSTHRREVLESTTSMYMCSHSELERGGDQIYSYDPSSTPCTYANTQPRTPVGSSRISSSYCPLRERESPLFLFLTNMIIHSKKNIHQLNWKPIKSRLSAVWLKRLCDSQLDSRSGRYTQRQEQENGKISWAQLLFFFFFRCAPTQTHTHKGISTTTLLTWSFVFKGTDWTVSTYRYPSHMDATYTIDVRFRLWTNIVSFFSFKNWKFWEKIRLRRLFFFEETQVSSSWGT